MFRLGLYLQVDKQLFLLLLSERCLEEEIEYVPYGVCTSYGVELRTTDVQQSRDTFPANLLHYTKMNMLLCTILATDLNPNTNPN